MSVEAWTMIFSGIAAVGAVGAGWIAWLVYREQLAADYPAMSVNIIPYATQDWFQVDIEVVNRSTVQWKADEAVVKSPNGAKLVSYFDIAQKEDGAGNSTIALSMQEMGMLTSKAAPRMTVAPAGTRGSSNIIGSRDRHTETLFLFLPASASRSVSIRYSVASTEAKQRRKTIVISRTLTAHPAAAIA